MPTLNSLSFNRSNRHSVGGSQGGSPGCSRVDSLTNGDLSEEQSPASAPSARSRSSKTHGSPGNSAGISQDQVMAHLGVLVETEPKHSENVSSLLQTRSSSRPTGWRTVAGPSPVTRLPPPHRRADPRLPAAAAAVPPQVRMPWAWLRPPSPAPPAPPLPRPVRNRPAAATAAAAPPPPSPAPSRFQLGKRRRVTLLQSEKILCLLQNHPHLIMIMIT